MADLPPPALIAPAPPPATALVEISDSGVVKLNWDLIRKEAQKSKADAGNNVVWTMARALVEANREPRDAAETAAAVAAATQIGRCRPLSSMATECDAIQAVPNSIQ